MSHVETSVDRSGLNTISVLANNQKSMCGPQRMEVESKPEVGVLGGWG